MRKSDFNIKYIAGILKRLGVKETDLETLVFSAKKISNRVLITKFPTELDRKFAKYTVSPVEIFLWYNKYKVTKKYPITEDLIMKEIAKDRKLEYVKLNPLKVDTALAIKYTSRKFARINNICPLSTDNDYLYIATDNPFNEELFEDLRISTKLEIMIKVSSKTDIHKIVNEIFGFNVSVKKAEKDFSDVTAQKLSNLEQLFQLKSISEIDSNDKHIINAVDYLMTHAITMKASDIHIEPKRDETLVRLRIDGILHTIQTFPASLHPSFVSRLKGMARMDISEKRKPQDGRLKMRKEDKEIELRMSTVPVAFGEKIVIRVFDPEMLFQPLEDLGFYKEQYRSYRRFIKAPNGLILITGPTGSGKTTTLYSSLKTRVDDSINILTIEDPIEMIYEPFNQIAVNRNPKVNLTFANALKTILRQDPDIIMVGEIRDKETAENAIQAALTGHLVFATLHTNDSVSTIDRLVDLGIDPFLVSTTLIAVMAQRLIRKICTNCKTVSRITKDEAKILGIKLPPEKNNLKTYIGKGCPECRGTGFSGRTAIYELLEITPKIKKLIIEEKYSEIEKVARMDGLKTIKEGAVKKLAKGVTSYKEVLKIIF